MSLKVKTLDLSHSVWLVASGPRQEERPLHVDLHRGLEVLLAEIAQSAQLSGDRRVVNQKTQRPSQLRHVAHHGTAALPAAHVRGHGRDALGHLTGLFQRLHTRTYTHTDIVTYLLTYLLTYFLTYLLAYLLTYLLTYFLTYLLAY